MNENWEVLEVLSSSDKGRIFKAWDSQSQKTVLIKEVRGDANPAFAHQLRQENRLLQKLHSRWIPAWCGWEEEEDGSLYLAEEYFAGTSLSEWLETKPKKKLKREVFLQICALIGQVHQAGYAYLDLKPANLIIANDHACLIDFDGAMPLGSERPLLANPLIEMEEETISEKSDQPGLGLIWEILFGKSMISWICQSPQAEHRFSSLAALEACAMSFWSWNRRLYAGAIVTLCLILLVSPALAAADTLPLPAREQEDPCMELSSMPGQASEEQVYACGYSWQDAYESVMEHPNAGSALWLLGFEQSVNEPNALLLRLLAGEDMDPNQVSDFLDHVIHLENPQRELGWFCELMLCRQKSLDPAQRTLLDAAVLSCRDLDAASALKIGSLYLSSEGEMPENVQTALECDEEGKQILSLYRRKKK